MKKSFLITILLGCVIAVGSLGCYFGGPRHQDEAVKYYDLIAIDKSMVAGRGYTDHSKEVYVFIFKENETRIAYYGEVSFEFDNLVEKPIVEGMLRTIPGKGVDKTDDGKLFEVTVTFKNVEQMKEYWLDN